MNPKKNNSAIIDNMKIYTENQKKYEIRTYKRERKLKYYKFFFTRKKSFRKKKNGEAF